jgi:hypothetical protein
VNLIARGVLPSEGHSSRQLRKFGSRAVRASNGDLRRLTETAGVS